MLISDWFKDMLNDLVDSLNDGSNTEVLAESRQIYILRNNILGSGEKKEVLMKKKTSWKTGYKGINNTITLFPLFFGLNKLEER